MHFRYYVMIHNLLGQTVLFPEPEEPLEAEKVLIYKLSQNYLVSQGLVNNITKKTCFPSE